MGGSAVNIDAAFFLQLAENIDPKAAAAARKRWGALERDSLPEFATSVLVTVAFPAMASWLSGSGSGSGSGPNANEGLSSGHGRRSRSTAPVPNSAGPLIGTGPATGGSDQRERRGRSPLIGTGPASLRRFVRRQKIRIALRELLPPDHGGAPFEVTSKQLSELAEVALDFALDFARREVTERFGLPVRSDGLPSTFCVLGMGKLGGEELNAGSDVDLVFLYDTDSGAAKSSEGTISLHEYWSRVARRLVRLIDEVTDDGAVWRVDMRLRPEGAQGAVVNSSPAMLRYYETWGQLWERVVLMRARPVAGDRSLGHRLLDDLRPFVFRKHVDPTIAEQMIRLGLRARRAKPSSSARDLKIGSGGIRDLELFVQSLQLIWGGTHPALQIRGTIEALRRLRFAGLVTEREAKDLEEAYTFLRGAEHFVQNATGIQTHALPTNDEDRRRLARCMGYGTFDDFEMDLKRMRDRVADCLAGLAPAKVRESKWTSLIAALDREEHARAHECLASVLDPDATVEVARDLIELSRRPDTLLGTTTRGRSSGHADVVLDTLMDSADPTLAARCLRTFFSQAGVPSIYAPLLADHPQATRRFINVLGASAYVGNLVSRKAELADLALFSPGLPTSEGVRHEVVDAWHSLSSEELGDMDAVAGAIRRAKLRVTMQVAVADLADEAELSDVTGLLSEVADSSMEGALRAVLGQRGPIQGFCVIAVGKLGGRELGYGSDLDVLFLFDPDGRAEEPPDGMDPISHYARSAQRTIRLLSAPHEAGPGYELDTRLRPSGAQGVLVTSLPSFARYHGLSPTGDRLEDSGPAAAFWERQTLVRARACAGDQELAQRVVELAHRSAYDFGPPDPEEIRQSRLRLQSEVGQEREGRYDLKLGIGGLLDVEFAVQYLQMKHGHDPSVHVTDTLGAIDALVAGDLLGEDRARTLRDGYTFLRRLEQRLHIVHATSMHLLEADAPGLVPLARRMGFRDRARESAADQLILHYQLITREIRRTYSEILGKVS